MQSLSSLAPRLLPLSLAALLLAGCNKKEEKRNITLKGSDTMVILAQRWAEEFMKTHPDITIQVTGGGSGTGFSALLNGTTDIANASRPIKSSEVEQLKAKYQSPGVEVKVAKDGITVYADSSNPVDSLTLEQLRRVYLGEITNWKELGGKDAVINLYGRENNSGTYEFFKEHVLEKKDFAANTQSLPGTGSVVNAVAKDPTGIGYGGHAYLKGVKILKVKADAAAPALEANAENIASGAYALSRHLYMYLKKTPEGDIKAFIDWVRGAEGQGLVTEVGYFPIR